MLLSVVFLSLLRVGLGGFQGSGSGMSLDLNPLPVTNKSTSITSANLSTSTITIFLSSSSVLEPYFTTASVTPTRTEVTTIAVSSTPLQSSVPITTTTAMGTSLQSSMSITPTTSMRTSLQSSMSVTTTTAMETLLQSPMSITTTTAMGTSLQSSVPITTTFVILSSVSSTGDIGVQTESLSLHASSLPEPSSTMAGVMPTATPPLREIIGFVIELVRPVTAVVTDVRKAVADLLDIVESDIDMIRLFNGREQVYPSHKRQMNNLNVTFDRVEADISLTSNERAQVETIVEDISEKNDTTIVIGNQSIPISSIMDVAPTSSSSLPTTTAIDTSLQFSVPITTTFIILSSVSSGIQTESLSLHVSSLPEPSFVMTSVMPTATPLLREVIGFVIELVRPVTAIVTDVRKAVASLLEIAESDIDEIRLFSGGELVYPQLKREVNDVNFTFDSVEADISVTSDEREQVETRVEAISKNDTSILIGMENIPILSISPIVDVIPTSSSSPPTSSSTQSTDTDMPKSGLDTGAIAGIALAVIFFILIATVLVAILVVYMRHRTVTKSYEFDVAEMTYMKNSDVWKCDVPPD